MWTADLDVDLESHTEGAAVVISEGRAGPAPDGVCPGASYGDGLSAAERGDLVSLVR
jgi:hypothetical protein